MLERRCVAAGDEGEIDAQMALHGDKTMKSKKEWPVVVLLGLVLISILVIYNHFPSKAEDPELSKVAFAVS